MGHADPATTHHQPLVRTFRLHVDHLPKHWFAGNVLLTHAINAQNLFFPTTEQFFVRSVHRHLHHVDDPALRQAARAFIGQEAQHGHSHNQVLDVLRAQGFRFDGWLSRYEACLRAFEWVAPSWLCLSVTAAMEHFTASVGECWLTEGRMDLAHPDMAALLGWHAVEEIEHKAVAFDVLQQVRPHYAHRAIGMLLAAPFLLVTLVSATLLLLSQDTDATWSRIRAEQRAAGRHKIRPTRFIERHMAPYLVRDFHPNHRDNLHIAHDYLKKIASRLTRRGARPPRQRPGPAPGSAPAAAPVVRPQAVARILDRTLWALPEPSLDFDALVARAAASSGASPPAAGRYVAPLRALLEAAHRAPHLNPLGRHMLARALSLRLHNHFAIDAHLAAHPEIEDEPIVAPIVIVSLPRTGTTALHRLLAAHPDHRALYTWEMDRPLDRRSAAARKRLSGASLRVLHGMCPDLRRIHDVRAGYPEECINLLANELTSMLFTLFYDLPGYVDHLHTTDLEPVYRAHKRQLQLLQHGREPKRWVLKAPFHLLGLDALLRVYPDAHIVQTHRDPTELVASEISLFASIRRAFHHGTDLHRLGRERLAALGQWLDRGLAARDAHPASAFTDLPYRELVRDPLARVEEITARLGTPLTDRVRAQLRAHASRHRQHRYGRHRYSLAQFGLEEATVRQRFAGYLDRFSGISARTGG